MTLREIKQTSPERFTLVFDDGTELKTTLGIITERFIHSGMDFDEDAYNELVSACTLALAKARALRIINARPMSREELRKRLVEKGEVLNDQNVGYCIDMVMEDSEAQMAPLTDGCICITAKGKPVKPKTVGQKNYCDNIRNNTITIGVGPAGTGKTYLAVAMAVTAFRAQQVNRIILTRPAVEAGEKLGFLPGDLQQKVDPYLRPLYDALFDMLGAESYARLVERGSIEVAPLAYMRGRTLDDSFIILDEAQNTTCEQMKMFLTRLGFNSKMVITGDITQIDLPDGRRSGLKDAMRVLRNVDDISVFRFTEKDVVRHRLVQEIIKAYDRAAHPEKQPNQKGED